MGLSNAERQKRHRDKLKERLRNVANGGLRALPVIVAELPHIAEDLDNSPQTFASSMLAEMRPAAIEMIEGLLDSSPTQANEIAAIFGIDPDPLRGLTWRQFHEAVQAAKLPKDAPRELLGRTHKLMMESIRPEEWPVPLSSAHSYRPLLERLGLWH